jgi:hypothetical protein
MNDYAYKTVVTNQRQQQAPAPCCTEEPCAQQEAKPFALLSQISKSQSQIHRELDSLQAKLAIIIKDNGTGIVQADKSCCDAPTKPISPLNSQLEDVLRETGYIQGRVSWLLSVIDF